MIVSTDNSCRAKSQRPCHIPEVPVRKKLKNNKKPLPCSSFPTLWIIRQTHKPNRPTSQPAEALSQNRARTHERVFQTAERRTLPIPTPTNEPTRRNWLISPADHKTARQAPKGQPTPKKRISGPDMREQHQGRKVMGMRNTVNPPKMETNMEYVLEEEDIIA